MLLDCATIPFVMLLSFVVLGARYTWRHFAGALLCFCGVATIVLSDVLDGSTSANGDDARGVLAVVGTHKGGLSLTLLTLPPF